MAAFDDDPRDPAPLLPAATGATPWPVDPDAGLDYCEWCARLRQADGLGGGGLGDSGLGGGLAELSAHVRAARRNDSLAVRRLWNGRWRGLGRVMLLSAATAAVVSGVLAVTLG
ncbi:hypothetical protein [Streptomyces sp. NRRL S-920]|uniref:hypothetical protein n=1 Tax=Streptomyces sp. NRRL S-920 TaxID=1463921 RepID=UPI00131E0AE5|nr:hypothetical protein [Streptomyces sp. NRRL S-920]